MKQDTNHTPAPQGRSTPTLIIGDVHGNVPFLEQVQATYPQHHKIFVGDFVDSRQFTRADELKGLDIVIGMRVDKEVEIEGLDLHEVAVEAYPDFNQRRTSL